MNNYVEVPVGDGKPKVKGGALVRGILTNANIDFTKMGLPAWENMSGGAWNINNNAVIVARAIQDYFVKGVDPEETIMASKNILLNQMTLTQTSVLMTRQRMKRFLLRTRKRLRRRRKRSLLHLLLRRSVRKRRRK